MVESIQNQYDDLEEDVLTTDTKLVPIVAEVVEEQVPVEHPRSSSLLEQPVQDAIERERLKRNLEMAEWAEELKFLSKAPPKKEYIEAIYHRLCKGSSIREAIEDVCSYTTWRKWQKEYPVLLEMEEEARQRRIWELQERQRKIADGEDLDGNKIKPEEDSIRKITRAKLRIDTMQSEIDRYDRLTDARNNKNQKSANLVPIQINVGYGRKQ